MAGKNKDASLNKRAFTSGFFFILAQLFARGLTFAVTPVYSRLLTKAQYGVVRTYESWLLIAYTIMSLCLWRSVDVAKKDFEDDYNGYVSSVHTLSYIAIASIHSYSISNGCLNFAFNFAVISFSTSSFVSLDSAILCTHWI